MLSYKEFIEKIKDEKVLEKFGISGFGIFGSFLHSDSPNDIDVLIKDYEDYELVLAFRDELEKIGGCDVDVVIEKYASPIILHRAYKDIYYVS